MRRKLEGKLRGVANAESGLARAVGVGVFLKRLFALLKGGESKEGW